MNSLPYWLFYMSYMSDIVYDIIYINKTLCSRGIIDYKGPTYIMVYKDLRSMHASHIINFFDADRCGKIFHNFLDICTCI